MNPTGASPRVLFVASEAWPLAKTGGLGDVAHALPNALVALGAEVRLLLPAYRSVLQAVTDLRVLGWLETRSHGTLRLLEARHAAFDLPLWLVDATGLYDRPGGPYQDEHGHDWPDNARRFAALSEAAALLADDRLGLGWRADVLHANDWQTGLACAFARELERPPRCVFTIHNIAYDCQIDYGLFHELGLPAHWWHLEHGEFHGRFSLLKSGIVSAHAITTVSPTYAREICTPEYGYGMAEVLAARRERLVGILNGIDTEVWNPRTDPLIARRYEYGPRFAAAKRANRKALLQELGADEAALSSRLPLVGFVGRLVAQKGVDLLMQAIERLLADDPAPAQFVLVGSGDPELERRLTELVRRHPGLVFGHIGYSERLAHLVEAGCGLFAMPSRFEPCGLNQMYSLRYGTPPVVRRTGGLADTVTDCNEESLAAGTANGFVFDAIDAGALEAALRRALACHRDRRTWHRLVQRGMSEDHGWPRSAAAYLRLYLGDESTPGGNRDG